MRRSEPAGPRGVLEVDWPFFGEICRALALKVVGDFDPEVVLGIAKAGVIPGVVVASILQREFASMAVTRRTVGAAPVLVSGPPASIKGRRILVVDETCDTGSTLKLALDEVRALQPKEVRTAVSFRTGAYTPDYHAFSTESFIILPWDREIIEDGALVIRPEYARRLEQ
ncbi:MAG: phosphoribosyltransferase family protein [Gemmatimonadales bacterium]